MKVLLKANQLQLGNDISTSCRSFHWEFSTGCCSDISQFDRAEKSDFHQHPV